MADVEKIADSILVDAAVLTSSEPEAILGAVENFAEWAFNDAMLVLGEFPVGAVFVANVSFYIVQIENGGHWQFAHNSRIQPDLMRRIVNALHLAGAHEYRQIFSEFCDIMAADPGLMKAALASDYSRLPESIKALDARFFALDKVDLIKRIETWIQSLPTFRPLPADDLAKAKADIIARNKNFRTRKAAAKDRQKAAEAADPKFVAAYWLCRMAGLKFVGFNAGKYLDGPSKIQWGMRTNKGVYYLTVGPDGAELRPIGAGILRAPDWGNWRRTTICLVLAMGSVDWIRNATRPSGAVLGSICAIGFGICFVFTLGKAVRGRRSFTLDRARMNALMSGARGAGGRNFVGRFVGLSQQS